MRFFSFIVSIALLTFLPFISSLPMNTNPQPVQESLAYETGDLLYYNGDTRPSIVVSMVSGGYEGYYILPLFGKHEVNPISGKDWENNGGQLYTALSALPYDPLKGPYTVLSNTILLYSETSRYEEKPRQGIPPGAMFELLDYLKANTLPYKDTSFNHVLLTGRAEQDYLDSIKKYIDTYKLKTGSVTYAVISGGRISRPILVVIPPNNKGIYLGLPLFNLEERSIYKGKTSNIAEGSTLYDELKRITPEAKRKPYTHLGNVMFVIPNYKRPIEGIISTEAMATLLRYIKSKWRTDNSLYPILDLLGNVLPKDDFLRHIDTYIRQSDQKLLQPYKIPELPKPPRLPIPPRLPKPPRS